MNSNINTKINSDSNDLLNEIIDYLQQIVKYTKDNLLKQKEKNDEINLEEENQSNEIELSSNKNAINEKLKLGEKINSSEFFWEKEDEENESNKKKAILDFY